MNLAEIPLAMMTRTAGTADRERPTADINPSKWIKLKVIATPIKIAMRQDTNTTPTNSAIETTARSDDMATRGRK